MENVFESRRIFNKTRIDVLDNKVFVTKRSVFDYIEFEVSFESIDNKKRVKKEMNHGLGIISIFSFSVAIICLLTDNIDVFVTFFLISLGLAVLGFILRKKFISITTFTDGNLDLHFTNRNEMEVRNFADDLIRSANEYMIKKFSEVDKDLPIENQLNNISYLKSKDLIDDKKFEELKNILLGRRPDEKSIGFN